MRLKNFLLAWLSLCLKLRAYFSIKIIIKAFVGAIMLANFIYLSIWQSEILNFISPFLTLAGIYTIINLSRAGFFAVGFFSGILWFYWVGFSFIYYDMIWAVPFVVLIMGLAYGLIFWAASWPSFIAFRAVMLFLLSYVHPFGFNWFHLEATLVLGIFDPSVRGLAFLFLAAIALSNLPKFKLLATSICLICAVQVKDAQPKFLPFEIELVNLNVPQELKWEKSLKNQFINENLAMIEDAINTGKRAVVLPESAFPAFMTHERNLVTELKNRSHKIAIIAGAQAYENNQSFNSAFFFDGGQMKRFDKLILVPFGEEIPLPNFMKTWINALFFDGKKDFTTAKNVSDYEIEGVKIRNAICYEATRDELFAGEFDVMIALTNNGWFKTKFIPSTQPVLQRNLLKYYATKYGKTIYHSVNGSRSEVITPKRSLLNLSIFSN